MDARTGKIPPPPKNPSMNIYRAKQIRQPNDLSLGFPELPPANSLSAGQTQQVSSSYIGPVTGRPSRSVSKVLLLAGLLAGSFNFCETVTWNAPAQAQEKSQAPDPVRFNRDIRPILSDNCFYCHGPDNNKREAGLRLDTREGLHGTGDAVQGAVVAGKPEASKLIERILSTNAEEKMPPPESGKEITAEQVELLKRWIAEGAKYEGHWAFLPIQREGSEQEVGSATSSPRSNDDIRDEEITRRIDARVAAGWAAHGLEQAAPAAEKITLLRRLYFDLTGLPPSESQVDEFLADDSPGAYERTVDRLLSSPHFGERMAMWWMDLVRYADTVGYHGDQDMSVSPFRDYVIRSFNENKPFDTFTIEQLAGDLLPNPTREQRIASGYNRLGMMSAEGGVQDKEYLAKYMAERVRNASGTWLGLTLGCAECHDHKFDPLLTKDFYRFGAFFADIKERGLYSGANDDGNWGPFIKVPDAQQESQRDALVAQKQKVESTIAATTPELLAELDAWENKHVAWTLLKPDSLVSLEGVSLQPLPDGSFLASGMNPSTDTYLFTTSKVPSGTTAFRLEVLPDDSLPRKGPGRAGNGNFVLSEFVVQQRGANGQTLKLALSNPSATYEQTGAADKNPYGKWAIAAALDGDTKGRNWGWAVMEQVGQPHAAIFETAENLDLPADASVVIGLWQNLDNPQHTIGRFRLWATNAPRPIAVSNSLPADIEAIVTKEKKDRTAQESEKLLAHFRAIAPSLEPMRNQVVELQKQIAALDKSITSTLITESVPPRMVRVLARGNWMDETGEVVEPAFPVSLAAVTGATQAPSEPNATNATSPTRLNRLDLAKWIVDPKHPLPARVLSNRLWKLYFGSGLSTKLDDLGAQGEWPSHPELLDDLASWMIDTRWDIKRWIKTVLMSQAYQRSSVATQAMRDRDPYNRYLARQARYRLDAEMVRDNALSVSGLLVNKLGGRSVKPYQPAGYWAYLNFPAREWQNGKGEELYRRGLYTHWQRQYLHPSLLVFDAPNREECTADRPRSNTPLQSLVLLNDPTYVEAARTFAEHIAEQEGDVSSKLNKAFRRALSRNADPSELQVLENLYRSQLDQFKQSPEQANELLRVGERPVGSKVDVAELAAWTSIARVVLNLHETITRY